MPQCLICKSFLPSDFCDKIPMVGYKCHFCLKGKNTLYEGDTLYVKQEVERDYEIFTKTIAQSPNIKDKIRELTIEAAVNKIG